MTYTHDDYLKDCNVVNAHYKGNVAQEKADTENLCSKALLWSDIATYAAVYPEYEQRAQEEIIKRLGYLPHPNIIIPHEVFIRTLIEQYSNSAITQANYERDLTLHVVHIRNDDMKKFGWVSKKEYSQADISRYHACLPQYKEAAQSRIKAYFGELPDLKYRLDAEVLLRKQLQQHAGDFTDGFTSMDYKTFTIITYRKAALDQGQEAADRSPLLS